MSPRRATRPQDQKSAAGSGRSARPAGSPASGRTARRPPPGSAARSGRPPASPRTTLLELIAEGATGLLRFGDHGGFYLADGAITHAEHPLATDVDLLVTRSRGLGLDEWRQACESGEGAIDAVLEAAGGRISRPELEAAVLIGIFDAAYFLMGSHGPHVPVVPYEFFAGARPRLEPVCRVGLTTLEHETQRRRARLHAAWPSAAADDAPVIPVRRMNRQRVILTAVQAEILLNADDLRTPCELARDLGRPSYTCLLAVRELGAAALIRTAAPVSPQAVDGSSVRLETAESAVRARPAGPGETTETAAAPAWPAEPAETAETAETAEPAEPTGPASAGGRRGTAGTAGTTGAAAVASAVPAARPAQWAPVDEALLTRLHEALKELG